MERAAGQVKPRAVSIDPRLREWQSRALVSGATGMADLRPLLTPCALAGLLLVAGCGKPEDARGYMPSLASSSAASAVQVKTPAPPVPAWATPLMGHNYRQASKGTAVCRGVLDDVTARHTGPHPGSEIEGWGWDERGAKPLDKVLFITAAGNVIGGADVGVVRIDVPKVFPEIKTPKVGWKGVADVISDQVQAIGVTADGDTCLLGQTDLG
jgi:hypothetical protein